MGEVRFSGPPQGCSASTFVGPFSEGEPPSCSQFRLDPYDGVRIGEAAHPGPQSLGDPTLGNLPTGTRVDVVVMFDGAVCIALWHNERCLVRDISLQGPGIYTLYSALICKPTNDLPVLTGDASTKVFLRPPQDAKTCWRLKELCAGLGGIAVGMLATGGSLLASADRCGLACSTLRLNHSSVVQGDLQDRSTRIAVHEVCPGVSCLVAAGVPCQGYSSQGLQRGFEDPRSHTLVHVLQYVWHSQAYGLILECVPAIAECNEAMQVLHLFANRANLQVKQVLLELADQWPMRRQRWWAALVPRDPPLTLSAWKAEPMRGVQSVIPEWPIWHPDQERALLWTEEERHAYSNPAFGQDVRILLPHSTAPTLLHSYGSPLDPCPCGCRRQGFARSSLLNRGLRGFGLLSCVLGRPRYLHPQEAALLCTLPVSRRHVTDVKAALCLLGQLAAPLHALWILAQVQSWFATHAALPAVDPQALLVQYKCALLRERHNAWLLPSMMKGGFLNLSRVDLQVPRFQVRCSGPVSVQALIHAESPFLDPDTRLRVLLDGRPLAPSCFLHFDSADVYVLDSEMLPSAHAGSQLPHLLTVKDVPARTHMQVSLPADDSTAAFSSEYGGPAMASLSKPLSSSRLALSCGLQLLCAQFNQLKSNFLPPMSCDHMMAFLADWPVPSRPHCLCMDEFRILVPFCQDDHWALLAMCKSLEATCSAILFDCRPGCSTVQARRLCVAFGAATSFTPTSFAETCHWRHDPDVPSEVYALAHAAAFLKDSCESGCLLQARSFVRIFEEAVASLYNSSPATLDSATPCSASPHAGRVPIPRQQFVHDSTAGVRIGEASHPGPLQRRHDPFTGRLRIPDPSSQVILTLFHFWDLTC